MSNFVPVNYYSIVYKLSKHYISVLAPNENKHLSKKPFWLLILKIGTGA